jgi:hypothetical protein
MWHNNETIAFAVKGGRRPEDCRNADVVSTAERVVEEAFAIRFQ